MSTESKSQGGSSDPDAHSRAHGGGYDQGSAKRWWLQRNTGALGRVLRANTAWAFAKLVQSADKLFAALAREAECRVFGKKCFGFLDIARTHDLRLGCY